MTGPPSLLFSFRIFKPQELIIAPVCHGPNELDPILPRSLIRPGGEFGNAVAKLAEQPSNRHALGLGRQSGRDVGCGDRSGGLGEIKLAASG